MLKDILTTKVMVKIARLFSEDNGQFQVSDVARKLSISKSRASECLRELEKSGLLKSRIIGRSIIYAAANTKLSKSILGAFKQESKIIIDVENAMMRKIKVLNPISVARFGSSLKGLKSGSDIDIIAIFEKDINSGSIHEISAKLTVEFGITISIIAMSLREFREKAKKGEEFVLKLVATHKLLSGRNLEDLIWQEKREKKKR